MHIEQVQFVFVLHHAPYRLYYYNDVTMIAIAFPITGVSSVFSTAWSGAHQRKHQIFMSLAFVREIYRLPVDSPHKGPVTRKNWWRHYGCYKNDADDTQHNAQV